MSSAAKRIMDKLPEINSSGDVAGKAAPAWNHRILIVEDESAIADAYRDILTTPHGNVAPMRRSSRSASPHATEAAPANDDGEFRRIPANFALTIVSNAEKAIAEVKHAVKIGQPFTMGFFDVLLGGGMDGIDLVKAIHEIDPDLHAVFVTAYSDRSVDSIQSLLGEQHANRWDYLNKPFTKGEILQKARNAVTLWNLRSEKAASEVRLSEVQRQLLENERMTSAAAVARGIGHEFRNILTLITGKAELGSDATSQVQMKEALETIVSASYRAAEILQRFNYLYAPSEQKIQKSWMHLAQPMDEALALMSHQLKSNNIKVCWIKKRAVAIHANETSLLQVFVNLLINSMHAMGTSGQIDLSVCEVDGQAEFRFRDYGPGIDPKIIDRVTEPFFTTKGDQGTGLGLSIAREIIEGEHDGKLEIANHQVMGLEIVITLPLKIVTNDEGHIE